MRCRRQCFGWPIVFLAAAAIGSPLVQPGSRVALYDGGSTEDLSSTAVPQLHAVDTPAPELADGCTFSVDFVPAESDLNGTCLLMEIGALLNGTGLYLVDGVPVFICKISSKAAKQPQSLEDLDFAGDSAVAVSHPFGRLHAGQQYLIAAVLNVGKSRLEFSVSDGSLGDVQQYTLFGMPEPANWAGNKTLSVAVQGTVSDGSPGSRGGLSSQPGIWDQTESKNLIGTVTRAAYWNAVLLSIDCRRALSLKTVDADATVSWISESGRNYTLQCREELSSGSWSNVTDSIHGSNETLSRTNLMKHSSEFFRVISERSPLFTDDFSTGTAWSGGYVQNNRLFLETGTTAMLNGVTVTDFELAVDVRPGNAQTQADILFRMNDAEEGYVLRLDTAEQMARWISSGASENELASLPMKLESGQWVSVRMIVRHENFKLFINEQPLPETPWPKFDGVDSTFTEGRVGLRVSGGAARFQSLEIYEPNGPVSGAMYQNPVQVNCADPVVLLHDGLYYAYCTYAKGTNIVEGIGLYTSPDLITWTDRGYALQAPDSWGDGSFWAPDIVERNGTFYLYYAAETRLCVATADSPLGPFTQSVQQPMEPSTLRIDA
ncbi:MAG: family 43 glycosylhydrolase, partial [Kiritimatiellales bacterium]